MDRGQLIWFIMIFLTTIVIIVFYLNQETFDPSGKRSAKATASEMKRFALLRSFKVLSNVKLKDRDGEEVIIENMLIGFFGILLVRTLGAHGEYYGTVDGDRWSLALDTKKIIFKNPVKSLERQEAALRDLFARKKVYKVPIFRVVYILSKSTRTKLFVTHKGEILFRVKLSDYLNKSEFEKDAGLEVKQIADCVLSD